MRAILPKEGESSSLIVFGKWGKIKKLKSHLLFGKREIKGNKRF